MSIFLVLFLASVAIADVCEGVTSFTIFQGENFEVCWQRNHPNDDVEFYRIYYSSQSDNWQNDDGTWLYNFQDNLCGETDCFPPPLTINEIGTHYLIVRAYDSNNFRSDPSNEVVLIVKVVVFAPINLTIKSVVKEE